MESISSTDTIVRLRKFEASDFKGVFSQGFRKALRLEAHLSALKRVAHIQVGFSFQAQKTTLPNSLLETSSQLNNERSYKESFSEAIVIHKQIETFTTRHLVVKLRFRNLWRCED